MIGEWILFKDEIIDWDLCIGKSDWLKSVSF
jgi:hypothetical protein